MHTFLKSSGVRQRTGGAAAAHGRRFGRGGGGRGQRGARRGAAGVCGGARRCPVVRGGGARLRGGQGGQAQVAGGWRRLSSANSQVAGRENSQERAPEAFAIK